MERKAHFITVGIFVLFSIFGLGYFILWMSNGHLGIDFRSYHIYFSHSVAGLKKGSPVQYKGVTVGEVLEIRLDPDDIERVRVRVNIQKALSVKKDVVAQLDVKGLTGGTFIQLIGGTQNAAILKSKTSSKLPVIPSKSSEIELLLERAPNILESAMVTVNRVNRFLGPANEKRFSQILDNIEMTTSTINHKEEGIKKLIKNFNMTSEEVTKLSQTANNSFREISELIRDLKRNDGELKSALRSIEQFSYTLEKTAKEAYPEVQNILNQTRYKLENTLSEVKQLTRRFDHIAHQLDKQPLNYISNGSEQGVIVE